MYTDVQWCAYLLFLGKFHSVRFSGCREEGNSSDSERKENAVVKRAREMRLGQHTRDKNNRQDKRRPE